MSNEIFFFKKINNLPYDIIEQIKQFIPKKILVFLNKSNYLLYHYTIKNYITNYENYIRDTIRRDNDFVFNNILIENYKKWLTIKKYTYKNIIFNNYLNFTNHYCIENDSTKCKKMLLVFMKEHGLCKNQHKKNIVKHIRWKN